MCLNLRSLIIILWQHIPVLCVALQWIVCMHIHFVSACEESWVVEYVVRWASVSPLSCPTVINVVDWTTVGHLHVYVYTCLAKLLRWNPHHMLKLGQVCVLVQNNSLTSTQRLALPFQSTEHIYTNLFQSISYYHTNMIGIPCIHIMMAFGLAMYCLQSLIISSLVVAAMPVVTVCIATRVTSMHYI